MFGAICGDVLGSVYENFSTKYKTFDLFPRAASATDDTVCTAAIASALLRDWEFDRELRAWTAASTGDGFSQDFLKWARLEEGVGRSAGNGSAMRVSSIPYLASSLDDALSQAARSSATSHDHPEAIMAAMAVAAAGRLALEGWPADRMGAMIQRVFGYDLSRPLDAYRDSYRFDDSAKGTVGPSLRAVIEATSFEDAMRNVISMGGDADTMAAIAGGVAEIYFPVPADIRAFVEPRMPGPVREVVRAFDAEVRRRKIARTPREAVGGVLQKAKGRYVKALPPQKAARKDKGSWLERLLVRGKR